MDAPVFVAGFMSCMSIILFLLLAAVLLSVSRRDRVREMVGGNGAGVLSRPQVEIITVRVPDHQEMQQKRLMLEAGFTLDSTRAVNGNANGRLLDITAYRIR